MINSYYTEQIKISNMTEKSFQIYNNLSDNFNCPICLDIFINPYDFNKNWKIKA